MEFEPGNIYHVYNQGNNRQNIFTTREDYLIFLGEIKKLILPNCEIIAFCLMPNHFHLLVYMDNRILEKVKQGIVMIDPFSNGIRKLLSGYARIYNKKYNRTGSLFRQKTKTKIISTESVLKESTLNLTDYAENCFHYIHQNSVKAGLVAKLEEWEFSSFRDYANLRKGSFCNKKLAVNLCSYHPEDFVKASYRQIF